jgi:hypothetical protein
MGSDFLGETSFRMLSFFAAHGTSLGRAEARPSEIRDEKSGDAGETIFEFVLQDKAALA